VTVSHAGDQPIELSVAKLECDAVAGVAVCGEVEIATAAALTEAVQEAIRCSSGPFVVDLGGVDFLDSTGLHCLVRARALLGREDRALAILRPRDNVRRVLAIAGIDELVPVYESYDELARALRPPG
jgi:anti-sigma B factor antagonist